MLGKPDESEMTLAEQSGGVWKPNPTLAADMAKFLQGADPEQFEMWMEELEDAYSTPPLATTTPIRGLPADRLSWANGAHDQTEPRRIPRIALATC
jgi:hypothetical protein